MYAIPLILLIVAALIATAWSPIFALVFAVPLFLFFLAYVGLRPRSDQKVEPPQSGGARTVARDEPKGMWGEPRA
jgi:hypothetical protein